MNVKFHKYQGTGNDFILLNNRYSTYSNLSTVQIKKLCDRNFGIGADGLMLLENMVGHDFKMVYFNSDGRQSTMCGNGGRCMVRFAADQKIIATKTNFIAIDGPHDAVLNEDSTVSLKMIDVAAVIQTNDGTVVHTGSPHIVVFVDDLDNLDILKSAHAIRYNATFKEEGINVNFVRILSDDSLDIRTYERGVENETLSCGTGVVAAALAFAKEKNTATNQVNLQTRGGQLKVSFEQKGEGFGNIWLTGAAQKVFEGSIEI
jgi:diaminopimelate epimerase